MRRILILLTLLAFPLAGCSEGPSVPAGPTGPAPAVLVDRDFGEPPVAGTLRIVPGPSSVGWRYSVGPIPPATEGRTGVVDDVVGFPFRFDSPGIHVIRVELLRQEESVIVEKAISVVDPESDFEILAQRPVEEIWPAASMQGVLFPEGIVMDPDGRWLYAANYPSGELVRIDPATLEVVDRLQLAPQLEGLSVTASGGRLFAVHKGIGLSVVDLSSFTATSIPASIAEGHFIQALDHAHALVSGHGRFARVDVDQAAVESIVTHLWSHPHFSLFPDARRVVAGVNPWQEIPFLEVLALPSLSPLRSIPIEELSAIRSVAVDPTGARIYILGALEGEARFVLVDTDTGEILASMTLGQMSCICVANPVVAFGSGRYVAFENGGSVVVVDTEAHLPRYLFDPGDPQGGGPSAVAAHPDSDILYVLGGNHPILRLYKIRLRNP